MTQRTQRFGLKTATQLMGDTTCVCHKINTLPVPNLCNTSFSSLLQKTFAFTMKIAAVAAALFLAALPASTSAGRVGSVRNKQITSGTKPVRATHKMMRHAKQISGADHDRQLQNGERDMSFLYQYSITFDSCHSATTVKQEGQDNGDEFTHLIASNSIQFNLCPTSGGRRCGTYLAPMTEFLQAYFESQMDEQEYQCEMARQQCEYEANYNQNYNGNGNNNNGNYNEQYAMNQCYEDKGLDYCSEYEGQEEFQVERYVECAEWEGNGEYTNYYIGPYCADGGRSVKLGMFQDGGCAIPSTEALETFNKYSYMELPFVKESMVSKNVAISCMEQDRDANNYYYQQQNNGNNNNNANNGNYQNWNQDIQISPFCEELYERSARCEKGLRRDSTYYWSPDNEACDYINKVLPALDAAAFGGSANHTAAKVFAWIYGILTVGLAGYVFWLHHQKKSRRVELSGADSTNVIS